MKKVILKDKGQVKFGCLFRPISRLISMPRNKNPDMDRQNNKLNVLKSEEKTKISKTNTCIGNFLKNKDQMQKIYTYIQKKACRNDLIAIGSY